MLFEAEQRALVTLHAIADAVIFVDARGCIDYLNRAAERLTGYPMHEARGRPVGEVVRAVDERSRERVALPTPDELAHDVPARLNAPCVLISRWGQEAIIKVSAALLDSQEREVTGIVLTLSDITEARLLAARVTHQATHDALTGVPNRVLLEDRLRLAIARARRLGTRLTVLFVDLDRFKTINDGFGHGTGDMLLMQVSQRLRSRLREEDTLARLGGDEFVVIAENVEQRHAIDLLAGKLRDAFAEPFLLEHEEIYVSATIGVAVYPQDGHDVASLLKSADQAMYSAKEVSRGTIQHFSRPQRTQARDRLAMDRSLRRALEREEFELWYQPQLELHTQRIVGVEALLRWRAPGRGLLSPGDFIGHAEDSGLILAIDEWVLAAACTQARRWQVEGLPQARISVNLSARQFMRRDIGRVVENALQQAQVEPPLLGIEITESAFVADLPRARANMAVLRMIGLSLAIDDFGTGFSSLTYLREFPIDVLKIDRTFIQDADGARGGVIAKAVIELAHGLRLRALAEGVETRAQLKAMRRAGCDELQGSVFSPARPATEIAIMLRRDADGHRPPQVAVEHDDPR
jgi:diguanylate cyclase (GGDEF)-like protein/PAS domain S-box-containing protein